MSENKKRGFFGRLKEELTKPREISDLTKGLSKTRKGFVAKMDTLLSSGGKVDEDLIEEMEAILITSDFGVETTEAILDDAKERLKTMKSDEASDFRTTIQDAIRDRLQKTVKPASLDAKPHVILVVGVNGVGKTTTIGKLAAKFSAEGQSVMLAAGDTFRAAAVEQLKIWGERSGCPVIAQGQNADSASVIFDAFESSRSKGVDLLIADTAGRLHTKVNLMEELKKIKRVVERHDSSAPHDVWLVLDATTGQNAVSQVKQFHEALGLTGLIITKLDGTAKGGVVVGLAEQYALPIHFIGVGEGVEDLQQFDPDAFVSALFSSDS
ncbi:MAG: signal recognition particle-docking protein FtsY [Magnetococcales bacterium]|nr:signal recognition particle-docking protein FtsY [Magnetococcales bacterium]